MDGISEYEMERRRKMERNHRRLQELGLVGRGELWKDPRPRKAVKPQRRDPKPAAAAPAAPARVAVRKSVRARRKPDPVYAPPTPRPGTLRGVTMRNPWAGVAVRKSMRTQNKASPSYRESDYDSGDERDDLAVSLDGGTDSGDESGLGGMQSRPSPGKHEEWTPSVVAPPTGALRRASTPSAPDSSRNLECDIPMLMERYLGRQFPSFGKAPVMELSTKSRPPKFSRMSGVTEWKNAVFLWVNVDGGSGYENLFERDPSPQEAGSADESKAPGDNPAAPPATRQTNRGSKGAESALAEGVWRLPRNPRRGTAAAAAPGSVDGPPAGNSNTGDAQSGAGASGPAETTATNVAADRGRLAGLRMTWFAGGRMTAESALIQRLLLPQNPPDSTKAEDGGDDPPSAGAARRAIDGDEDGGGGDDAVLLFCRLPNEPYVFCGRLSYSKHWADERPVRFVWRLLDTERLSGLPDFEAVVEVAGVDGGI